MKKSTQVKSYFPGNLRWFEIQKEHSKPNVSEDPSLSNLDPANLYERAKEIYESQCQSFQQSRAVSNANRAWLQNIIASGTLKDKTSALSVEIQECGIYSLSFIQMMLAMAKKTHNRESQAAIETLKDVFSDRLLPPSCKLRYFDQQLVQSQTTLSKPLLVLWYFEDAVKKCYLEVLKCFEAQLRETLPFSRTKALSQIWELFINHPEQEQSLLSLILNKLGDTNNKVASKASYLLLLTSQKHSNMMEVLVRETRNEIEKPSSSLRSVHYGLVFMNQIVLSASLSNIAGTLIDSYFSLFKRLLNKKQQSQETHKCISAILTGINRAFPFSQLDSARLESYLDDLFKLIHSENFNTAMQAMNLLFTLSTQRPSIQDRFYRSVYEMLLDPIRFACSSKQPMFINLVFKILNADLCNARILAFFKRILQLAAFQQPPFICACLVMLSEIIKRKGELLQLMKQKKLFSVSCEPSTPQSESQSTAYDYRKRDPKFCNAEDAPLFWDMHIFQLHYHPSVVKYANSLACHQFINCTVDPFDVFTCAVFLDKFSYKNPKKLAEPDETIVSSSRQRGISAMQPIKLTTASSSNSTQVPVNLKYATTDGTLRMKEVPEDELFFAQFFTSTIMQRYAQKRESAKAQDEEELDDEEFEKVLNAEEQDFEDDDLDEDAEEQDFENDFDEDENVEENDDECNLDDLDDEDMENEFFADEKNAEDKSDRSNEDTDDSDIDFFASEKVTNVEKLTNSQRKRSSKESVKQVKKKAKQDVFADAMEYLSD